MPNKKSLKRQNEDTLYTEMHYRSVPNKKSWAQAMEEEEEEDTQRPSRGPPGARLSKRELKDSRKKKPYSVSLVTPVAQALEMAKSELDRNMCICAHVLMCSTCAASFGSFWFLLLMIG
jgi:hypothetical protein